MAKLCMHLFWSEPSNFAFASFLRSGVFHRICARMANQQSGSSQVSFTAQAVILKIIKNYYTRSPVLKD